METVPKVHSIQSSSKSNTTLACSVSFKVDETQLSPFFLSFLFRKQHRFSRSTYSQEPSVSLNNPVCLLLNCCLTSLDLPIESLKGSLLLPFSYPSLSSLELTLFLPLTRQYRR